METLAALEALANILVRFRHDERGEAKSSSDKPGVDEQQKRENFGFALTPPLAYHELPLAKARRCSVVI
jgi:hypothetical protein